MHYIIGNFSKDTIALINWCKQHRLKEVVCLYVDTSWASPTWLKHVGKVNNWLESINYSGVILKPKLGFLELVREQKTFPNPKFATCVSQIKAATLLQWIEKNDPNRQAIILLAKRRQAARAFIKAQEYIAHSEHYNNRTIWHPLYKHSNEERDFLLQETLFESTPAHSQECFPCIHCPNQVGMIDKQKIKNIQTLEKEIDQSMFEHSIQKMKKLANNSDTSTKDRHIESRASACGSPFGCGF